jgi:hypothetical protein
MRSCGRPAERGETTRRFAERAMELDATRELPPSFVRDLNRRAGGPQSTFPGFESPLSATSREEVAAHGTPLAQSIQSEARRLERDGVRGSELMQQAVQEGLRSWKDRHMRQIEQYGLINGGEQARPAISAAREALDAVDTQSLAKRIVLGLPSKSTQARRALDVDEDLTRPK